MVERWANILFDAAFNERRGAMQETCKRTALKSGVLSANGVRLARPSFLFFLGTRTNDSLSIAIEVETVGDCSERVLMCRTIESRPARLSRRDMSNGKQKI